MPVCANVSICRRPQQRPSSSGPGRRPFTAETGVRFPVGAPEKSKTQESERRSGATSVQYRFHMHDWSSRRPVKISKRQDGSRCRAHTGADHWGAPARAHTLTTGRRGQAGPQLWGLAPARAPAFAHDRRCVAPPPGSGCVASDCRTPPARSGSRSFHCSGRASCRRSWPRRRSP